MVATQVNLMVYRDCLKKKLMWYDPWNLMGKMPAILSISMAGQLFRREL